MTKRNPYDGRCSVCHAQVRALEGVVEAADAHPFYRILCPEHMPA
jgi:predicted DCC family thiol-disulfide oxidoreductase YuxK